MQLACGARAWQLARCVLTVQRAWQLARRVLSTRLGSSLDACRLLSELGGSFDTRLSLTAFGSSLDARSLLALSSSCVAHNSLVLHFGSASARLRRRRFAAPSHTRSAVCPAAALSGWDACRSAKRAPHHATRRGGPHTCRFPGYVPGGVLLRGRSGSPTLEQGGASGIATPWDPDIHVW